MKLNATTDLRAALRKLEAAGGSASKVLRREVAVFAGSFTRDIVQQWTPPAGPSLRGTQARKAGEKAVHRDVHRIFATAGYAYQTIAARDPAQADYFWLLLMAGDYDEAQRILRLHTSNARLRSAQVSYRPTTGLHQTARKNGRVPTSQRVLQVVRDQRALANYIKARQAKVGLLMAGWKKAAAFFNIRLHAWVERHPTGGQIRPQLTPTRTAYRITNDAPHGGVNDLPRKARALADIKMNQLRRRLPFVIKSEIRKLRTS